MAKSTKKFGADQIVRLLLLALLVPIIYASGASALTAAARAKNFQFALLIDPSDPAALAAKADNLFLTRKDAAASRQVKQLARASLSAQALNARALRLIAYTNPRLPERSESSQLIELAARASRRELGTQVWLIEQSVANNDAAAALRHYDIALRTNTAIRTPLFTQLTLGIELPIIRTAIARYVRSNVPWIQPFFYHAIEQTANPASVVAVVNAAGGMPKAKEFRDLETLLLSKLVSNGQFEDARKYYLGLPDAKPSLLSSLAFDSSNTASRFGPLAWQPMQGAAVGAEWSGDSGRPVMAIFANSGERGVVAQKWLFLKPGRHLLSVKYGETRMPGTSSVQWTLSCVAGIDSEVVWQSELLQPSTGQIMNEPIDLGAACPNQNIRIVAAGGQDQNGAELTIESMAVTLKQR